MAYSQTLLKNEYRNLTIHTATWFCPTSSVYLLIV